MIDKTPQSHNHGHLYNILMYTEEYIVPSKDLKGMPWGVRDVTFGCS